MLFQNAPVGGRHKVVYGDVVEDFLCYGLTKTMTNVPIILKFYTPLPKLMVPSTTLKLMRIWLSGTRLRKPVAREPV